MAIKILWLSIAVYAVLRVVFSAAEYAGDRSSARRAQVGRHFTAEDIERGFEYSRRGFALKVAFGALSLAVLVVLAASGLSARFSDLVRQWSHGNWLLHAVLFTSLATLALFLLYLPFAYYFGHVLEHRFGFSKLSTGGWLLLEAKNLLVLLVMSTVAAVVWFGLLRLLPRWWVAVIPAAFTLLQVFLMVIFPLVLLPMYYTSDRLADGPFRQKVTSVLEQVGIHVKEIFVINESRYSTHTNAFFTGVGPTRSIYLFDTLLKDHSEEEALTVVAHEAGHWAGRHVLKGVLVDVVLLLAGCLLLRALYPELLRAGGVSWRPLGDPGSLPAVLLLVLLANFVASPLLSAISRKFEREADRTSLELTGNEAAFIEAEKRLARTNRSQLLPHPLVVFWYHSHPPIIDRIAMAEAR